MLLGYGEASRTKKVDLSHASQILTNDRQILVLSMLSNHYCTMFHDSKPITSDSGREGVFVLKSDVINGRSLGDHAG